MYLVKNAPIENMKKINKIPLDDVMEFLRQEGMEVTKEEAELIMEFLYQLTDWTMQTYFDKLLK